LEIFVFTNIDIMKKSFQKFIKTSLKKLRQQKDQIRKLRFSTYPEEFVITEQEEREGGFFGLANSKLISSLK